ncbi:hypothetical protein H634G_08583 [Metarhizium anisopliae BRIP 53293]|uniref:Uncharacterized protein n=1 Tax=Metarhizium anisopliae BRIP 53293 TaxID=1291518 RepID=A0A0D9NQ55_METAN|nr:hypothetical protein H634G_08583 [Metarhizium anisopliae BRIP 53293]KJK90988.1 hypothetical protein H633G_05157 [Metarhizium anisopliae BRIP 53284]
MSSSTERSDKPFSTKEASQRGHKPGGESLNRPPRKPQMPPVFHPITGEKLPAGYTLAAETNRYDYTDDQGIRRSIHMPKGTASAARRYAAENNYTELAKFPVWSGQGYNPEDYDIVGPDGERHSCKDFMTEKKKN